MKVFAASSASETLDQQRPYVEDPAGKADADVVERGELENLEEMEMEMNWEKEKEEENCNDNDNSDDNNDNNEKKRNDMPPIARPK